MTPDPDFSLLNIVRCLKNLDDLSLSKRLADEAFGAYSLESVSHLVRGLPNLINLELTSCSITDEALEVIVRELPALASLKLSNKEMYSNQRPNSNTIGIAGVYSVCTGLPLLRTLDLSNSWSNSWENRISDEAVILLARSLPSLEVLDISINRFTQTTVLSATRVWHHSIGTSLI